MEKIVLDGMLENPEREDGGSALCFYGFAYTPAFGDDEIPGFKLDLISYHESEKPEHSISRFIGKKVKVTLEFED